METQWNSGQHSTGQSRQLDGSQDTAWVWKTHFHLCESLSQSNVPFKWSPLPLLSVCTNQAAGLPVPPLSDWRQSCTRGEPRAAPNCQTQVKHNLYTVTTKYWTNFYGFNTLMLYLWVLNNHFCNILIIYCDLKSMTLDILNQISNFFNFFSIILCHGLVPRWEEAVFGFGGTPHFIVYNISSASGGQECQPPATSQPPVSRTQEL